MFCCKHRWVGHVGVGGLLEGGDHALAGLLQDVAGGLLVDEPAVHDVGASHELAGLRVDRHDDHHDPVAGELPPVAEHLAADVADAEPVDEGHAGAHALPLHETLADLDHVAVLADRGCWSRGIPTSSARRAWCCRCRRSPCTGMNHRGRNEREQQTKLLLRRVAARVDRIGRHVEDVGAAAVQRVDHPMDRGLVPGDQARRQDHRVALLELDPLVLAGGHQAERRVGLALAARADDHHAARVDASRPRRCRSRRDRRGAGCRSAAPRRPSSASIARGTSPHARRRSPRRSPVAPGGCGSRSTRRRRSRARCRRCRAGSDRRFAREVEWPGSSALVESDSNTCTPRPASSANPWRSVAHPSIGVGSSLKSPVCRTVPYGVSTATANPSGIEWVTCKNRIENPPTSSAEPGTATVALDQVGHLVLLELALQQLQGERRPDHRHRAVQVAQEVRQRADVILVAVGEDHRLHVVGAVPDELHVGQDEIDARHVGRRERQPDVDDEEAAVDLEAGHVAADLADPAEEDEPAARFRQGDRRPRGPRAPATLLPVLPRRAADASGRRRAPIICNAAFTGIGFDVTNNALNNGARVSWIFRAAGMSPVWMRSSIWWICGPTRWLATLTTPTAPRHA